MFEEYFGQGRPVDRDVLVQTINRRYRPSVWNEAWFIDWEHIGDDSDVIGYRVASPLRRWFESFKRSFQAD